MFIMCDLDIKFGIYHFKIDLKAYVSRYFSEAI